MMRLVGVNIPDEKRVDIALTYLYGIGKTSAIKICDVTKINPGKKAKELKPEEIDKIKNELDKTYKIEGELRQVLKQNIGRLKEIKSYRGIRHIKRLPVRGQRTKTNSRTVRGNVRKTAGSGKRKTELK
ncbi:MAG: 30S ribosomal protein S13 [Candidatus Colwellbacteria bacterium RIFCSPHIGHO2_12_FULL_43_12]|uniref:Small ribosomal subunit protein uS13 n=3 Tax=Candidatus Colwelliibacteriota TaxID=1817904 RepID=A0A1G1YXZ5_9BACT|nr:MAG: 30S ribosomal protein S13 [Candidatus Colwellbacteria bacterium RIFCSPHIGHO2_02_FULL_43_15]OGY59015.1 MAG: 30S ribosomal protein S13 [Candidatus Colwellbacteria bacterium RIFCSPHIGHO2_12_FULL_43_12]OGY60749.1 MAG: 30S ribosomal protein S13 [Candidatus Colwellbacteria bacterium RIFCSPLOWO2_12_FULL_43_11]